MADNSKDLFIGIDLGTTYHTAAIYRKDDVENITLLTSTDGTFRTPSFVFFSPRDEPLIGFYAQLKERSNQYRYTCYDNKCLIGQYYNNTRVQHLISRLRYTVEEDSNRPVIVIHLPDGIIRKTPIEICSLFLTKIKNDIELQLREKFNIKAVLTVPTHFNQTQQNDILAAARLANLQVLHLLMEPTAIAYRYFSQHEKLKPNDKFLVYNLGGSRFNAAIFKVTANDTFDIVGSSVDPYLSGQEFDQVIFNFIWNKFDSLYMFALNPHKDFTTLRRYAQVKSELIKIRLSKEEHAGFTHNDTSTTPPITNYVLTISRKTFEQLAKNLIEKPVDFIHQLIIKNDLDRTRLQKVLLCGGSVKIPKIRQLLLKYFKHTPIECISDSTVAEGAALFAGRR